VTGTKEALRCTQCGEQVSIVEVVEGFLDWGPAVVDDQGVVRPQEASGALSLDEWNSTPKGAYAHCDNRKCGYRWKLRRRFVAAVREEALT
jgi:hypothetical protein